ncbi:ATP-binding protein [Lichenicola sp.]|uniref:ATP-binding protein n=1 Tax=Lichenicola sp. TaxID=2804529 RepID=UPI003AFFB3E3
MTGGITDRPSGIQPSAAPRLLLVEDSDTQALQIRRVLERHGFAVDRAASAEAALERLNEQLPELVVSDYHLPGMNGGELARELRLNVRTRSIPVLMLTEASEPGLEREGLESGADAYVPKSADQELIVLRIRALLRQSGGQSGSQSGGYAGSQAGQVAGQGEPADGSAARPASAAAPTFGHGVGMFRRGRILLVGERSGPGADEGSLAALLARDGHLVETAAGPEQARALLQPPRGQGAPDDGRPADTASEGLDCVVVDLLAEGFDGIAFCAWMDATRQTALTSDTMRAHGTSFRILGLGDGSSENGATSAGAAESLTARAYAAGVDDVVSDVAGLEAVGLRIRAVVRRKLLQDETARIEADMRERQAAFERARGEAADNAAKAALAEALAQANAELADANARLREAQGKLVQAAKMASLGELVAGIAHEINNPLAFILAHQGTVERLLDQLGTAPSGGPPAIDWAEAAPKLARARQRVGSMSLGLKRIQNLVLNLRKFSRLDESEQQSVDVPDAIETVLALLTHKLGSGITVERVYDAPRELMCQPALLNQVIMNIVGNAADALNAEADRVAGQDPANGTQNPSSAGGRIEIRTSAADGLYAIAIEDNGPGVPEALRERIFEPFFTTKPVGSGTGLGLAIAYSVVQAHSGAITIDTAPAGGARFTVVVPQHPVAAAIAVLS